MRSIWWCACNRDSTDKGVSSEGDVSNHRSFVQDLEDSLLDDECYGLRITFCVKANGIIVEQNAPHSSCFVFQRDFVQMFFFFRTIPSRDAYFNKLISLNIPLYQT